MRKKIEDAISIELETRSFEEILEDFDLTPQEVFWRLFQAGIIDQELLENMYEMYD